MALTPSYARAAGVVTGRSAASGTGATVTYDYVGHYLFGGEGVVVGTAVRPFRQFASDDMEIVTAAPLGSPVDVWFDTAGNRQVCVPLEIFGEDPC